MGEGGKEWRNSLTVIHAPAALEAHDRGIDHNTAALGLLAHVVDGKRARVHDTLEADIEQGSGGLLEVAILVDVSGEVVCAGA